MESVARLPHQNQNKETKSASTYLSLFASWSVKNKQRTMKEYTCNTIICREGLRQENHKLQTTLGFMVKACQKKKQGRKQYSMV